MSSVAALFIDPLGPYPGLLGVDACWDVDRDARTYAGTDPVIAHPPCQLSAYGHKAQKRTWLLYVGDRPPIEARWERKPGTHQCGWFDRIKPTLGKREASESPPEFAAWLIALARQARLGS